ncbi:MAG TPA: peptidylprolyl isomerase [Gemmataceae bacterium]|nr:peptidylprolyl isomerase [Gemmataceae bacterium]
MADCARARRRAGLRLAFGGLLLAAVVFGCHRGSPPAPTAEKPDTAAEAAKADAARAKAQPVIDPRLNQTFAEATRQDPPPDAPRPPDTTVTNKSVGKLYTEVVRLWKEVPFVTADGKRLEYSATVETDAGNVELALLSDAAPNHVRNFVALARAGYYDGLSFDRIRHEVLDAEQFKGQALDVVEGGAPLGAEDLEDHDSIGYWLKSEANDKMVHEEGSVGAVRGAEPDTAACKFYIMLNRVPPIINNGQYTVFGKVTSGLDVVRKIHQQPVIELEPENGYTRPEKPVVIRKVTIHTKETDTPGASGENK